MFNKQRDITKAVALGQFVLFDTRGVLTGNIYRTDV